MKKDSFTCRICNAVSDSPKTYLAKEIRFGWNEEFEYVECPYCGTIQIRNIPNDLDRYYSNEYYSLKERTQLIDNNIIRKYIRKIVINYRLTQNGTIGKFMTKMQPNSFEWIEPHLFDKNSSIIDIGCGTGRLVIKLAECGFKNISGIEPYINKDITYNVNGKKVIIKKGTVDSLSNKYDVLVLSHVFEHVIDPCTFMEKLKGLMHNKSKLIVSLPLLSSYTWNLYGIKSLPFADCPRHLHILTYKGLCNFANRHGMKVLINKPYFSDSILKDVYGNSADEILSCNKNSLRQQLLNNNDTGLNHIYLQLCD
ncbi:MAG: class I SAM-dependent methyltransferase [Bacteroidales bacterium]|nr:class I SAM-dependent methyltransferase [Bacteroidales bacterium]